MALLPEPTLRAAQRWVRHLGQSGLVRSRALLFNSRDYADLTPTQYEEALRWLRQSGLLGADDVPTRDARDSGRMLQAVIETAAPAWLPDADLLIQDPSELPGDLLDLADALGISNREAFSLVRQTWGNVDTAARKELGDLGEQLVVALLEASTNCIVDHVAAWSDSLGYDIRAQHELAQAHIEVKTTSRRNRLQVYLSRNEFETMRSDPAWVLVVVFVDEQRRLRRVETVEKEWLLRAAPGDATAQSRWESARFDVASSACRPGIPALLSVITDSASELLTGTARETSPDAVPPSA